MGRVPPQSLAVRFSVNPGDVSPAKVARRLHLTRQAFEDLKTKLFARGFPRPDPDTGNYDLEAVDRWRKLRPGIRHLFPELTDVAAPPDPEPLSNMGERFREAQKRGRDG